MFSLTRATSHAHAQSGLPTFDVCVCVRVCFRDSMRACTVCVYLTTFPPVVAAKWRVLTRGRDPQRLLARVEPKCTLLLATPMPCPDIYVCVKCMSSDTVGSRCVA